jgi:hypothetical protein
MRGKKVQIFLFVIRSRTTDWFGVKMTVLLMFGNGTTRMDLGKRIACSKRMRKKNEIQEQKPSSPFL